MMLFNMILLRLVCISMLTGQVKNKDNPQKGEWDFNPQKIWEVDHAEGEKFSIPVELRVLDDGTVTFSDFANQKSYIFDGNGKYITSFAGQGEKAGEISRYLNCFTARENIVIGSPESLHFFTMKGEFIKSVSNNLFRRFPLFFLDENEFLFKAKDSDGKVIVHKINLVTDDETMFTEFPVITDEEKERGGPSRIFLGLTPQVKVAYHEESGRFYSGRSDSYEITVTDSKGKRMTSFGLDREKRPFSDDEKRKYFTNPRMTKEQNESIISSIPNALTYFMRIQVNDGLIYVFAVNEFSRTQKIQQIDIFSPEGKYLYCSRLQFGDDVFFRSTERMVIRGEDLYVILSTENGKNTIAKYRLTLPGS